MFKTRIIPFLFIIFFIASVDIYSEPANTVKEIKHENGKSNPVRLFAGIEMVLVTHGSLMPFWISRCEVTQELYKSVMETNPSYFKGDRLPVEQVSWYNAVEFCNRLSIKAGYKPYYNIDRKKNYYEDILGGNKQAVTINADTDGFRLPASAEWECAAHGGSSGKYFWGDLMNGDYCWYGDNSGGTTHPVGTRKPNLFGIYDITGNVREWCFDLDILSPGLNRMVRDGHYSLSADEMQLDKADYHAPNLEFGFIGIRLIKNK